MHLDRVLYHHPWQQIICDHATLTALLLRPTFPAPTCVLASWPCNLPHSRLGYSLTQHPALLIDYFLVHLRELSWHLELMCASEVLCALHNLIFFSKSISNTMYLPQSCFWHVKAHLVLDAWCAYRDQSDMKPGPTINFQA